ncbi:MAG: cell division protein ZapA [Bacteroidales bacterium]|nr:cell division protein ZapA [Bacteroidales bacterium]
MDDKRNINVKFENKPYPLRIQDKDDEEQFYREVQKEMVQTVEHLKNRYTNAVDRHNDKLTVQDYYVMTAFNYATVYMSQKVVVDKIIQLTAEIKQFLRENN